MHSLSVFSREIGMATQNLWFLFHFDLYLAFLQWLYCFWVAGLQECLCTECFPSLSFSLTQIINPFSENTWSNQHTFRSGLTLTYLKIIKTQEILHFLITLTQKFSRCYSTFNSSNLAIAANFLTKTGSQPQVLAGLHQLPFSVPSKSFQTDVQEMGMLLLFSRRVVPPRSWVSGNTLIGLLRYECYMSSHYLSSVKENICSLTNQGSPFPFLSSLAHWIFKALNFGTFYFQSRERQGDELSFLIKSLQYFYITEWLCLVCAIFIPGGGEKKSLKKG